MNFLFKVYIFSFMTFRYFGNVLGMLKTIQFNIRQLNKMKVSIYTITPVFKKKLVIGYFTWKERSILLWSFWFRKPLKVNTLNYGSEQEILQGLYSKTGVKIIQFKRHDNIIITIKKFFMFTFISYNMKLIVSSLLPLLICSISGWTYRNVGVVLGL